MFNPMGPQIRTALHNRMIANMCNHQSMEIDGSNMEDWSSNLYDTNNFPKALNNAAPNPEGTATVNTQPYDYSPSCPQLGVAEKILA